MADALFDTPVFIDFYRGDTNAKRLMEDVVDGGIAASVSAITSFKLWLGISTREEEVDYLSILAPFEDALVDARVARQAGLWLRQLSGRQAEALSRDALIAASAAMRNEVVYTRNVRDFARFISNVRSY